MYRQGKQLTTPFLASASRFLTSTSPPSYYRVLVCSIRAVRLRKRLRLRQQRRGVRVEAPARRRIARGREDFACAAAARRERLWEDLLARALCAGRHGTRRQTHTASDIGAVDLPLSSSRSREGERTMLPAPPQPVETRSRPREVIFSRPFVVTLPFIEPTFKAPSRPWETERAWARFEFGFECLPLQGLVRLVKTGVIKQKQISSRKQIARV